MANFSVPYLVLRDGRPRWSPGPRVRALGFKGRDLKDERGQWLSEATAIAAARKLNEEVEKCRAEGVQHPRPVVMKENPRSCRALFKRYAGCAEEHIPPSPAFARLGRATQADYLSKLRIFIAAPIDERATFGDTPVGVVGANHLYTWWEELYRDRGHTMANGTIAVVRAMFSYAQPRRLNWLSTNPASKLGLPSIPPRLVVWTPQEIEQLIAAADAMGLHSVADAIVIALHTGQRLSDVLQLKYERVVNGRVRLRQGKTGARVSVPLSEPLQARLAMIRMRRLGEAGDVTDLAKVTHLVISEATGVAYDRFLFGKKFALVRAAVAELEGFAGVADKQFLDLRDTAVTRLALAECSMAEICSITGHSFETVHKIMKHYLALDDRMADSAIEKLRIWMAEEGIAV